MDDKELHSAAVGAIQEPSELQWGTDYPRLRMNIQRAMRELVCKALEEAAKEAELHADEVDESGRQFMIAGDPVRAERSVYVAREARCIAEAVRSLAPRPVEKETEKI